MNDIDLFKVYLIIIAVVLTAAIVGITVDHIVRMNACYKIAKTPYDICVCDNNGTDLVSKCK
jgi:hypothetical protein